MESDRLQRRGSAKRWSRLFDFPVRAVRQISSKIQDGIGRQDPTLRVSNWPGPARNFSYDLIVQFDDYVLIPGGRKRPRTIVPRVGAAWQAHAFQLAAAGYKLRRAAR